ncbi:3-dehydroquinate dehydratase [Myxococcota bacterium]|nr:3-dehydroquinate dehydratase [Myxococcota bacterium]
MPRVSIIHGPNLNLLGTREPEIYGHETLADVDAALVTLGAELGLDVETFQSNHEGHLIDRVQAARGHADAILLNAGGYTHTSVALRDAVAAVRPEVFTIEVHLSIPGAREDFRRTSLLEGVVRGRIEGFGPLSYLLALRAASALIARRG